MFASLHLLPATALLLSPTAWASAPPQNFSCSGSQQGQVAPRRFAVTVDFGKGGALTVLNGDGSPHLSYWSDVATGELQTEDYGDEPMVWTLVTGSRATLMGHGVRADGSIFSLTIRNSSGKTRPFELYESATGSLTTGNCLF